MIGLQEYDLKIKVVRTVKGDGLCRLTTEVVHTSKGEEELASWEEDVEMYDVVWATCIEDRTSWYVDVR